MTEGKVTAEHLARDAYLYIRQSTLRQVVENGESTQRQYALRDRAVAAGWPIERIQVIDCDLGRSGAQVAGRDGFQRLVSEVALGKAGIVMGLEVSRLARNSADWAKLVELCAITATLLLDEDAVYDATSFNDRLLLGLKGTMSEAELHILKARLRGGLLNKARRGDLAFAPPVGLVYRPDGRLELDPDAQVQAALRLVFATFGQAGSALQTLRRLLKEGVLFPRRIRTGPNRGELEWIKPQHSRLLQILHNPRYGGAFVYGRTRGGRCPDGTAFRRVVPRDQWSIVVHDRHPGYITWAQFEANQRQLAENAKGFGEQRRCSPVREGPALLQGRVLCGICGARMSVRYKQERYSLVPLYVCQEEMARQGGRICQTVPGKVVDPAISALLLELMTPVTLEVALAVEQEVAARLAEVERLLRQQVERARYEAELARRRYMQVDPDHRLVADTLEAEWNARLRTLTEEQRRHDAHRQHAGHSRDMESQARIRALAEDFPRVWNDPLVGIRERKRMLRLLVEDVTLIQADRITVHVRLRGSATRSLELMRPLPIYDLRRTKPAIVAEIDRLLDEHGDGEVAERLNAQGRTTSLGAPFTARRVEHIRRAFGLPSRYDRLRAQGLLTLPEMAQRLGISPSSVHGWARSGILHRQPFGQNRSLYALPSDVRLVKGGHGRPITFASVSAEQPPT
jgi:DNA invertase Pin-like site-specific DNA recombinase/predicted DNA-binding transcriptional regulator AlpA